jgi:hypothetical protein
MSVHVQVLFKLNYTNLEDAAVWTDGTAFRCVVCFFLAGARRGGASAENLRRLSELSSLSAASSWGRGKGAFGRLSERASIANRSSSVIS